MSIPSKPRAVVTGAGSGLGRALCIELAQRQARLIVSDRDLASARETALLVEQHGGEAQAVECDVTRLKEVEALARAAEEVFGGTDLVVNDAGIAVAGPVGEVTLEDWRRVLDINLWGVIHGCHTFAPRFKSQGSGHVLNIASAAGLIAVPNAAPYCASKAAVVSLSEALCGELQPAGVGVTVACPTFFRTNLSQAGTYTDENARAWVQKLMDRASISAQEVARSCLESVDRNELYAVPMADGRWMWRLRRLSPSFFVRAEPLFRKFMGPKQQQPSGAQGSTG